MSPRGLEDQIKNTIKSKATLKDFEDFFKELDSSTRKPL